MKPKFTDEHRFPDGYTSALKTDVAKTIERAKKRIQLAREVQEANAQEAASKTLPLRRKA